MLTERRKAWKRFCKAAGILAAVATFAFTVAAVTMQYLDFRDKRASSPAPPSPRTTEDLYLAGTALQRQGRCREAIEIFRDALDQARTDTEAGQHQVALLNLSLGQCYLSTPADCKQVTRYLGALTGDESGFYDLLKVAYDNSPCK